MRDVKIYSTRKFKLSVVINSTCMVFWIGKAEKLSSFEKLKVTYLNLEKLWLQSRYSADEQASIAMTETHFAISDLCRLRPATIHYPEN